MAKTSHRIKYGMTKRQVEKQLVPIIFLGHRVRVHKKVLKHFEAVDRRVRAYEENLGLKKYVPKQVGTFAYRNMRGKSRLSEHALGVAMDLDWSKNPMQHRRYQPTIPSYVTNIFKSSGFEWGGDWRSIYDPMHYQIGDGRIRPFKLPKKERKVSEEEKVNAYHKKYKVMNVTGKQYASGIKDPELKKMITKIVDDMRVWTYRTAEVDHQKMQALKE